MLILNTGGGLGHLTDWAWSMATAGIVTASQEHLSSAQSASAHAAWACYSTATTAGTTARWVAPY